MHRTTLSLRPRLAPLLAALAAVTLICASLATTAGAQDLDEIGPPTARIVNGVPAEAGEIPHQVFIFINGEPLCGGSIVGPSTIVSAAHCFDDQTAVYSIRAGVLDFNDPSGQTITARRVISHPGFATDEAPDIAVLQLQSPLVFNDYVSPIGLADADDILPGRTAVVSGWGALNEAGEDYPDTLLKATVTLVGDAACNAAIQAEEPGFFIIEPLELCATAMPSDSCYGDSGGPLTVGTGVNARLGGVVSWGLECGGVAPGVYAEVPALVDWITNNSLEPLSGTLGAGAAGTCNGMTVTVDLALGELPTAGDDVIAGTPGDDVIGAGAGNDVVCGLGGNDTIWGQAGDDVILGGDGDDKVRGGPGADELRGGDGVDDLAGGTGDDMVYGEAGDDAKLRGGTGVDMLDGGAGNDALISGNGGEDQVFGGAGNDKVTGGPRKDQVSGGDGDDEVRGNKGADVLMGGAGNDSLFGGPQPDQLDGGAGTDACNGGSNEGVVDNDTAANCEGALVNIP